MKTESEKEIPELSLIEGGPGDALMRRLRLIRPELGAASGRTAIILIVVTWLPLFVFSMIEGLALGERQNFHSSTIWPHIRGF